MAKKSTNNERNAGRKPKPYPVKILKISVPEEKYAEFKKVLQNKVKKFDSEFVINTL